MAEFLDVEVELETPSGMLALQDPVNGYSLHSESLANQAVSWRKHEITSDWIEGNFTNSSVRNNVVEQLSVWVEGETPYELATRLKALTDGLRQLQYQLVVRFSDLEETMTCFPADYAVEASQPMRFATTALVKAQVPRLPTTTQVQVVP